MKEFLKKILGIYTLYSIELKVLSNPIQVPGGFEYTVQQTGIKSIHYYFLWFKYKTKIETAEKPFSITLAENNFIKDDILK